VLVYLFPCILHIIDPPLETEIFPEGLKEAKDIPLHKGSVRSNVGNWSLISGLILFSKIFDKVVHKRKMNTQIITNMPVYIDFKKAFDTVDFNTLSRRLESLGVKGVCLNSFHSFMSIKVVIAYNQYLWSSLILNVTSSVYLVNCAVPQGGVLGPL